MRILHVVSGLLTGGAENMLLRLADCGARDGDTHRVVALADGPMRERFVKIGVQVDVLDSRSVIGLAKALRGLKLIVREWQPSVVQGWMYHGNLAATWAAGFGRRHNTVWNVRQTLYDIRREKTLTSVMIHLCRILSRVPEAIVYNSHVSMRQHEAFGFAPQRSTYIGNGVDIAAFDLESVRRVHARRQLECENAFVVGMAARFHPMKGHTNFLEAAACVIRELPGTKVVLAGRDLDRNDEVQRSIDKLGLRSSIVSLGELTEMQRFYSLIDVCVSSSLWGEGFPNVLVEAMAYGVPCVTTDVGDAARVVGDTGEIVAPGDVSALARAIIRIGRLSLSERNERGRRARKKVECEFDVSQVARQYSDLYVRVNHNARGQH